MKSHMLLVLISLFLGSGMSLCGLSGTCHEETKETCSSITEGGYLCGWVNAPHEKAHGRCEKSATPAHVTYVQLIR